MSVSHVTSTFGWATTSGHGGTFGANLTGTPTSATFTYTPTGSANGVLFWISCAATVGPTTASLAASGWTITQIASLGIINGGGGWSAVFWAYSPNTSAATFTVTFNQGFTFVNSLIDEVSGMDATNFIDASNSATGSSASPTVNVTPVSSNCMVWAAMDGNLASSGFVGTIGGTTANAGTNDFHGNGTEYLLLSGQAGVSTACQFTQTSAGYGMAAVAIKPLASAKLFLPSLLNGLGAGGAFFRSPLG